jgi:hypothetical protein
LTPSSTASATSTPIAIFQPLPILRRYPSRPYGEVVNRGRRAALGRADRRRQQERGLPIIAACPADRGGGAAAPRCPDRDTESPDRAAGAASGSRSRGRHNSLPGLCARGVAEPSSTRSSRRQIRASFLLAGPLLARFGEARMPPPGGDFIGRRRPRRSTVDAFADLGRRVAGRSLDRAERPYGRAGAPARSSWTSPR